MHFRFVRFQHTADARDSLDDLLALIGGMLMMLGHTVEADDKPKVVHGKILEGSRNFFYLGGDAVNVVFEGFHDQSVIDELARAKRGGARIVGVAPEQPTAQGWNFGKTPEAGKRMAWFPRAAEHLAAIWHLVPGDDVTAWYSGFGIPAAYLDFGYVPSLHNHLCPPPSAKAPRPRKVYPLGTFGSVTPRRLDLIKALSRVGTVGVPPGIVDWDQRNACMRLCKVGLEIGAYDGVELVSSSRCAMMLHLGLPVVGDARLRDFPWGRIVDLAPVADLPALAQFTVDDWQRIYARQIFKYRKLLPGDRCIKRVLAATLPEAVTPAPAQRISA